MTPAPSPVLVREGYLSEEDLKSESAEAVNGYGAYYPWVYLRQLRVCR